MGAVSELANDAGGEVRVAVRRPANLGMSYPLIMELWIDDGIRSKQTRLPGS